MANEIEENLVLNIEKALEAIDQFAKYFEQSVAAFSASLAESLSQVFSATQILQAQLDLEAGDSSEVVQAAIGDEQTTSLTFEDTNASDVGEEVQSELSSTAPNPISVPLEGEDAGLSETFDEAFSDPDVPTIVVPVDADASEAVAETTSFQEQIENFDSTVVIDADSSALAEVEDALDALRNQEAIETGIAPGESKELEDVSSSLVKINEAAPQSSASLKDLNGVLTGVAFAAKATAAGIAAAATASLSLFNSAVQADSAVRSFNASMGTLAPALERVDVDGFNGNLKDLAQFLGSSDEAVLSVAQRFGQLGLSSDATSESIATANSQLFGVAGNLRAINPALGTLDEIASRAGTAFIRGGRAATALGVSLTAGQIRARAYSDTQKNANEELTQFELFAAGASLAAKQFGDSIGENISAALDDPIIRLARLREIFGDTLEALGKPLISPFFAILDSALPVVLEFARVLSDIASAILPGLGQIVKTVGPAFSGFAGSLLRSVERIRPALESAGDAAAVFAEAFLNITNSVAGPALAVLEGYMEIVKIIADVMVAAGEDTLTFALALGTAYKAFQLLDAAFKKSSFGLILSGVALATAAIIGFSSRTEESTGTFSELTDEIFDNVQSIDGLTEAIQNYLNSIEEFVVKSRVLKDADLVENLNDLAISADTFASFVNDGREGLEALAEILLERLPKGGRISAEQLKAVQEGLGSLSNEELETLLTTLEDYDPTITAIGKSLVGLQEELQRTSEAEFNELVVLGRLSEAEKERILLTLESENVQGDYTRALELGNEVLEKRAKNEADAAEAYKNSDKAVLDYLAGYNALSGEVALGVATSANFEDAISRVGLEVEDATALFEEMTAAVGAYTSKVLENVPSAVEALSRLGEDGVTSRQLLDDFEVSLQATREWSDTLVRLAQENKGNLLQVAAELGPERTRLLIETYGADEAALNDHLQRVAFLEMTARVEAEVAAKIGFLQSRKLYEGEYEALAQLLRDKAFFGPLTREDLDTALLELQTAIPGLEQGGVEAGAAIGDGTMQGLQEGYERGASPAQNALRAAIAAAQTGGSEAAETAGRETGLAIGAATTEGLTQGLGPVTGILVSNLLQSGFVAVANAGPVGTNIGNTLLDNWRNALFGRAGDMTRSLGAVVIGTGAGNVDTAREAGGLVASETNLGFSERIRDSAIIPLIALGAMLAAVAEENSNNAYNAGFGLGADLMEGLAQGISRNIYLGTLEAARAVRAAESAARDEAESDSPSKAWERLGRDLVAGLSKGLDSSSVLAARSAAGVVSSATPSAAGSSGLGGLTVNVPITISGGMNSADGRAIGEQVGQAAGARLLSMLRMEARVA